ncbi:S1C family serine protease [Micrococcus sp.]|uniref:S1C family serine protease n=1 Tax=Micrococcus sp. TaxID=1271 RepID=UPI002A914F38|nr:trypsin-like peptidase domain-containing protein [Micrococcus sp.]MDY6055881.1 trypsin-like peptidase domain-containing protein [Micrococcus sp.]
MDQTPRTPVVPPAPAALSEPIAPAHAASPHSGALRPPAGRHRLGTGLAAAVLLSTALAGCGVAATEQDAPASSEQTQSQPSDAAPSSSSTATTTADTPVGDAAAKALPSVVTISVTSGPSAGSGSGSILDTEGHILTNTHVVTLGGTAADPSITVRTSDGKVYAATVVGTDPLSDLAVLKIDAQGLTPIELGSSADLKVGDDAIAIGAPLGLPNTVTDGIVSTLDRTIAVASAQAPTESRASDSGSRGRERFRFQLPDGQAQVQQGEVYINVLQTDAAINPGNSGGALVDSQGRLVGVNVAIASAGTGAGEAGNIGVGFAIPVDHARRVAEDLIEHGSTTHGLLGVTVTPQPAQVQGGATDTPTTFSDGARVRSVAEGSPAARAGLQEGDVITAMGRRVVGDTESLTAAVREYREGENATLTYLRDGREHTAEVTFTATGGTR